MRIRSWPFLVGTSSWRALDRALPAINVELLLFDLARELGLIKFKPRR